MLFQVLHQGIELKLELTSDLQWGEHYRMEAFAYAGLIDQHLSNGPN